VHAALNRMCLSDIYSAGRAKFERTLVAARADVVAARRGWAPLTASG